MFRRMLVGALALAVGAVAAIPVTASPQHPTLAEVNSVVDVLRFRNAMMTDPARGMATYSVDYGRASLMGFGKQMVGAGINTEAGWRFLLGTSVFTATGVTQRKSLVVFYNPWVDSVLFTVWQPIGKYRRIVDAAWVPGDLVRGKPYEPRPLWLRGKGYRPDTLAQSVVVTVKAIEARFGNPARVLAWRGTLGVKDAKTFNRLIPPMLALTLDEMLMRLKALAVPVRGEDLKLKPLRSAALALIRTAQTRGFAPLLAQARETTAPMRKALGLINPRTMIKLTPVAFLPGQGQVTMFFGSMSSADYAISARFVERRTGYALAQLEFIPYAAIYKAETSGRRP